MPHLKLIYHVKNKPSGEAPVIYNVQMKPAVL